MKTILAEINSRRARRALDERPVPADALGRLVEAATLAPSCANNQPWRLLALTEKPALERARAALTPGNYWAKRAPVLVLFFTRPADDCRSSEGRDYALFDCGLAAQNLLLQAVAEGLTAHPLAGFDAGACKREFGLPEDAVPIVLIAVGYPGDESGLSDKHRTDEHSPRHRRPLNEVVFYNKL
jgi:nitroreductase